MISKLHPTVFILDVCSWNNYLGRRGNNLPIIERYSGACALNTKIRPSGHPRLMALPTLEV